MGLGRGQSNSGDNHSLDFVVYSDVCGCAGLIQRHITEFQTYFPKLTKVPTLLKQWQRPGVNNVKINVDGSYMEATSTGCWGFIICNHSGLFIGSGAGRIDHCVEAMYPELIAVRQALFLKDAGLERVILETDAINVKTAPTTQHYDLAKFAMLIMGIKDFMQEDFQSI